MRRRWMGAVLAGCLVVAACSDDDDDSGADSTTTQTGATAPTTPATTTPPSTIAATSTPADTTVPLSTAADTATVAEIEAALAGAPQGCDPLDTRHCFLPFPSNAYLAADPATDTGRRVQFPADGAPVNAGGVPVDVSEWNRADGFSPNTTILVHVPGLDAAASKLPPWTDLEASLADGAPVVLVDLETGERVPLWAEPDARAGDDADRTLVIHPAVPLEAGHTFAVGLRGLVTADGTPVEPTPVFRAYRDELVTDIAAIEDRRPSMDAAIAGLVNAGIDRDELQLAWDFTVASTRSITERMLHIRDETLTASGEASPAFTITSTTDDPLDDGEPLEGVARQIVGTFTVPNWLTGDGSPGNGFQYATDPAADPDALPVQNGTLEAPFACNIPDAVMDGTDPGRISYYGHGLLGSEMEVNAGNLRDFGNAYDTVFCATKWAGMSEDDIGNAVASLQDLSNLATLTDRLQQGVLNQIVLGRLLLAPDGLTADPAFLRPDGSPLVDNASLVYDGNSQGGIMGLMLAAVSPDVERFVLGVPGVNYGILLPRSVDFDTYETVFEPAYPNDLDRALLVSMIQMLWDRGEGAGYVQHVTDDPLPGTPPKDVLLHVAFGDWQVSELTAFIAARALGIPIHRPVTADGRSGEVDAGWGLDTLEYPSDGSAILVWDSGSDPIPFENVPPRTSRDPHGDPRRDTEVQRQKAGFLFDGAIVDVCQGGPCTAAAN